MKREITIRRNIKNYEQVNTAYNKREGNKADEHPNYIAPLLAFQPRFNEQGYILGETAEEINEVLEVFRQYTKRKSVEDVTFEDINKFLAGQTFWIRNGSLSLNLSKAANGQYIAPLDVLKFLILKNDPRIAASREEVTGIHDAYIDDPLKDEALKLEAIEKKDSAMLKYQQISNSEEDLRRVLTLLKGQNYPALKKVLVDTLSPAQMRIQLSAIVDKDPDTFVTALEDKDGKDKYFIEQAIEAGLFERRRNIIIYEQEQWANMIEALEWLRAKENKSIVQTLTKQVSNVLEAKKKMKEA